MVYYWPISLLSTCCQFAIHDASVYLQPCCPVGRCLLLIYSHRLLSVAVGVGRVGGFGEVTGVGMLAGIGRVHFVGGGFSRWVCIVGIIGAAVGYLDNHSSYVSVCVLIRGNLGVVMTYVIAVVLFGYGVCGFASTRATCRAKMESAVSSSFSSSVSLSSDIDDAVSLSAGGALSLPFREAIMAFVTGIFCPSFGAG